MSSSKKRNFIIKPHEIEQFLYADSSGDEDQLALDAEDLGFLEEDADLVGEEVTIDPPDRSDKDVPFTSAVQGCRVEVSKGNEQNKEDDFQFKWKK